MSGHSAENAQPDTCRLEDHLAGRCHHARRWGRVDSADLLADNVLANLAQGWDVGYEAAVSSFEAGLLRLATQGVAKGMKGLSRPANPYRRQEADRA